MVEQILPATISTHIFEDLRRRIIEGNYAPGQALREEEIRELHGSSRGPIRESLRMLLQTGLVEHQPRRGFRVREYSERDIRQIYAIRASLEAKVVGELVDRDLGPLLDTLDAVCNVMRDCYERNDFESYFDENRRFHQTIIDFADNRVLREVMEYVNEVSLPVRYRVLRDALPSRRSLTYHEEIVAHLRLGEVSKATELTQQHILENLERAVEKYKTRTEASRAVDKP